MVRDRSTTHWNCLRLDHAKHNHAAAKSHNGWHNNTGNLHLTHCTILNCATKTIMTKIYKRIPNLIRWKYILSASENNLECTQQTIGAGKNRRVGCISLLEDTHMKSPVVKRSIIIAGHKTSVSLEDAFWSGLKEIAHSQHMTLSNIVCDIDTHRHQGNLSSAIRLFVLDGLRNQHSGYARDRVVEDIIRENGKAHV